MSLSFANDYSEGAHPAILDRLARINFECIPGYGMDPISESAKQKIKKACGSENAEVFFIAGGTQTNQLVIDTMLGAWQGVISAETGHINTHEAGAAEFTGHKVLALPSVNGKLKAEAVKKYLEEFFGDGNHEHMVFPGMVYISQPTEYGTLYSKAELTALSEVCSAYELPLYIDGARLIYALAAEENDVTLKDIAALCDAFYIGGTKAGALLGEALVFTKKAPAHFVTRIKQHGALLAKGWIPALQFDVLFEDDLYIENGRNAIKTAAQLKKLFAEKGYRLYIDSPTNQVFVILENSYMEELGEKAVFSFWEKYDETHTVVRFATSWATPGAKVEELGKLLKHCAG